MAIAIGGGSGAPCSTSRSTGMAIMKKRARKAEPVPDNAPK